MGGIAVPFRIRSIVVPVDFSALSEAATARAATLAEFDGAAIHLVHAMGFSNLAVPYDVTIPEQVWDRVRGVAKQKMEAACTEIERKGVPRVTSTISDSHDAVATILEAVDENRADLVVMGTHGYGGLKHAFLGSVTERALRTIDTPILAVKEEPSRASDPIRHILLAVDFSAHSDRATDVAADLAKGLGASIDVVHAFELSRDYIPYSSGFGAELEQKIQASASARLDSVRERLEKRGVVGTLHARRGDASTVIGQMAEECACQLVVMGTRGNSGLAHVFLGSVAERTMRIAPCSVLAVKAIEPRLPTA